MTTLDQRLILQPEPGVPETALPLILGPALAACGVEIVVETASPLPGGAQRVDGSNFSLATINHISPDGYRTIPLGPLVAENDWPSARSLGQLRFHEAAAVLTKRIEDGPLIFALRQAGAAILSELDMWEHAIAFSVIDGAWSSGTAAERYAEALGESALQDPGTSFPPDGHKTDVFAPRRGTVRNWDRAGLQQVLDIVGPRGSITHLASPGTRPGPRQPIARIWCDNSATGKRATAQIHTALRFT